MSYPIHCCILPASAVVFRFVEVEGQHIVARHKGSVIAAVHRGCLSVGRTNRHCHSCSHLLVAHMDSSVHNHLLLFRLHTLGSFRSSRHRVISKCFSTTVQGAFTGDGVEETRETEAWNVWSWIWGRESLTDITRSRLFCTPLCSDNGPTRLALRSNARACYTWVSLMSGNAATGICSKVMPAEPAMQWMYTAD